MKKKMVGEVPGNVPGMMADLNLKLQQGNISQKQLEMFLKKQNPFAGLDYSVILADWERYFWKIHGLRTDFAGVRIPEADDKDVPWFICRPENFFAERAFSGGKKLYPKWKHKDKSLDLDDVLDLSFGRDGQTYHYIVRVRANWEADEDMANISANGIVGKGFDTICLTERLLLGDFLFWKYERHLDIKNITLCAGSRYSDGDVPDVDWDNGRLRVGWSYPDEADPDFRSRQTVS